jgi:hypothetical protein
MFNDLDFDDVSSIIQRAAGQLILEASASLTNLMDMEAGHPLVAKSVEMAWDAETGYMFVPGDIPAYNNLAVAALHSAKAYLYMQTRS